jgi:hypothetical protein
MGVGNADGQYRDAGAGQVLRGKRTKELSITVAPAKREGDGGDGY